MILTSGTTGTPKGAPRNEAGIEAAVSLLSRLPLRYGWRTHIAAPLFHTWGFAHLALAMLLGSTVVLRRKFDPEGCLQAIEDEKCDSLVVIPVMLQRILQLPEEVLDKYDLATIKCVAASGSALPGDLATELDGPLRRQPLQHLRLDRGGLRRPSPTPVDLREAPDSAGKPPYATVVKILDDDGKPVPDGETGRIFVGNSLLFEGYTGGGHKEIVDGLMSSGDVGRFGEDGRLYVEGRDDEMIVSGGENVFPKEVEDCLARHDAVVEVAAIGVDDDEFGKRLRAFVVVGDGADGSEDELKDWVKENLARYKVPREIVFLDELPRNSTGKILKRELAEKDSADKDSMNTPPGLGRRRPRPRLHAARPVRAGRDAVVVPRVQGRRADLLPLCLLRCLHRRDGRHPRPAGGVPHLRHRGARHLLRPDLRPAGVRRLRRAQLPAALGLLAARRGDPRVRRLRRGQRVSVAVVVRHRQGRRRAVGRCTTRGPRSGIWRSIWPSSRPWPRRFS